MGQGPPGSNSKKTDGPVTGKQLINPIGTVGPTSLEIGPFSQNSSTGLLLSNSLSSLVSLVIK